MHLAEAFIPSDLHCIYGINILYTFPGNTMQEIHNAKNSVLLISNETQTLTKTKVKL